jgi:hypothetical protein
MGGPPAWELGMGLTTPHHKYKLVTKRINEHRQYQILKIGTTELEAWHFPSATIFIVYYSFYSFTGRHFAHKMAESVTFSNNYLVNIY